MFAAKALNQNELNAYTLCVAGATCTMHATLSEILNNNRGNRIELICNYTQLLCQNKSLLIEVSDKTKLKLRKKKAKWRHDTF